MQILFTVVTVLPLLFLEQIIDQQNTEKLPGHMERQEMETEMEIEAIAQQCLMIGLVQTTIFSAGQKLNIPRVAYYSVPQSGQASFFESVEVKGHVHIISSIMERLERALGTEAKLQAFV